VRQDLHSLSQVVAKLKQLQADAETIVAFLSNESAVQQLKQDKAYNLRFLQDVRCIPLIYAVHECH